MTIRILVISELYWPYGGGAELATDLIIRELSKEKSIKITILTGTVPEFKVSDSIKFLYSKYLYPYPKPSFWKRVSILCKLDSFIRILKKHDIIYIPRIAYPIIPVAKKHHKKVVVHLHNYQPLSFTSTIFYNEKKIKDFFMT